MTQQPLPLNTQASFSAEGALAGCEQKQGLTAQLLQYREQKFTGRLSLTLGNGVAWHFYLHLGRLVWIGGGESPTRQWRRSLLLSAPHLTAADLRIPSNNRIESMEYHILVMLTLRQKIDSDQATAIVTEITHTACFDMAQAIALHSLQHESPNFTLTPYPSIRPSSTGMLPQAAILDIATILQQSQAQWQQWVAIGLTHYSPNLAPRIVDAALLEQQTSLGIYQQLTRLINGQRSLRDIAALKHQSVLTITHTLVPFIDGHLLTLAPPKPPTQPLTPPPAHPHPTQPQHQPLIACIDDDPRIQARLNKILTAAGYRVLSITNPIEALPLLLQTKPDAVLLDLIMPVANGYEICAQIRRVQDFAALPVIMLTGNDGVVDRMRAKMVGASGFLTKSTSVAKITAALQTHCGAIAP
ncbi:response regulator [Spirulina major CS-329]|uniref:response regulator n=1 Tax=Spirulina TaxID=1154 RepID=UPI00232FB8CD|nr:MULTISPECIES: response regulator [Spirulina]MDB9495259.1 response regulator [Spirulina subsalsa CS-330]MDB9501727.1 response regulator [Spirulina major CS-329]